jgi:hypothetical protein
MNDVVRNVAAAALGHPKPLNINDEIITLAKYIAACKAKICARCLEPGHAIGMCPTKGNQIPACSVHPVPHDLPSCRSACSGQEAFLPEEEFQEGAAQGQSLDPVPVVPVLSVNAVDSSGVQLCCDAVNDVSASTFVNESDSIPSSVSTLASVSLAPVDSEDVCLIPNLFQYLVKLTSLQPTVDAFASPSGSNSLCPKYRHVNNSCFSTLFTGDTGFCKSSLFSSSGLCGTHHSMQEEGPFTRPYPLASSNT